MFISKVLPIIPLLIVGIILLALGRFHLLSLLIGAMASLSLWFWRFLFKPLIALQKQLSLEILEEITPHIDKTSKSLTTLSSAAIVLTISVIQVAGKDLSYKNVLAVSWYFFAASIGIGIIMGVISYILRTHNLVLTKHALPALAQKRNKKNKKIAGNLLKKVLNFEKTLFIFAFFQLVTFFAAMCYAISFAVRNI